MPALRRGSSKIDKQIVHIRATDFLRNHPGEIGLDVCCGPMLYRPFFKTGRYVGLDLSPEELAAGRRAFPDAESVELSLFDMKGKVAGDVVCCIQAIGSNQHFDHTKALEAVRALTDVTRPQGALVFNIGRLVLGRDEGAACLREIKALLEKEFQTVRVEKIGFCEKSLGFPLLRYLVYPFARLLLLFPFLYKIRRPTYVVFTAEGKK